MNSVNKECQQLKDVYDSCFLTWFSDQFLKGSTEDSCAPLLIEYRKCVHAAIRELNIEIPKLDDLQRIEGNHVSGGKQT